MTVPDHSVHEAHDAHAYPSKERSTAVLDVRGLRWASQQSTVTAVPGRRPGVLDVEANPVAQTATVVFDRRRTTPAELRRRVEECGYHCAGQSVPAHVCDPMAEPDPLALETAPAEHAAEPHAHEAHEHEADIREPGAAAEHAAPEHEEGMPSPHDMMGHGGHGGMSMAAMVADMRGRFLAARLFSIPVVIWSPIGRDVFKLDIPVPFGLREDVWALLLSLPVIFTGALPIAAGVFEPAFGLVLRPEIAALSMSHSSFVVAVNALSLKGLRLPSAAPSPAPVPREPTALNSGEPARRTA
ncbi:heavy metal translocating P-type ATPase [Streptomyces sp. NPDC048385]|uniref:heavy metal translocating P-type ATPase n=1 Tax=unclassified Streptomyces TaxID=2593676 RepID=UPI00342328FF